MPLEKLHFAGLLASKRSVTTLMIGLILGLLFLTQLITGWELPGFMTPLAKSPKERAELASAFYSIAVIGVSVVVSVLFAAISKKNRD